ncbi:TIGR04283 family arsenosugar biosynthesis glycosyltransferase [Atopobacter sp. AH10]|uniref:TIGR04283 family arsenosugar biosynthesis glycosyltransferase n=1 Tax=Atopobacter sp. AH10 TaxID=2315861 RepID=UPI001EFF9D6A|nr:TIGR04283 family arsenosugar biosynthesis glycosyltransferase [Atopobacter sp. AH10]
MKKRQEGRGLRLIISIIIPVLNEEDKVDFLHQALEIFKGNVPYEVILVDGGSKDRTAERLKDLSYEVVESQPGRGIQLNEGVKHSRGDILFFYHMDSSFKVNPLPVIEQLLAQHPFAAFPINFDQYHPLLWLVQWGSNWRLRHRKIAFGDQGMCMTRVFYEQMKGFKDYPLMEDYDFSIRAKKRKVYPVVAPLTIQTSARRFRRQGIIRTLIRMQFCQYLFRSGEAVEVIQKRYELGKKK